jgi:uncharacterized protein (DUF58 family)
MKSDPKSRPDRGPSNFRARWRRWTRPPRRLSFTAAGKYFVFLTLGIGFGAINTGDNLLFLLLGMMLSLILASGVLSEAVIRRLDAKRSPPSRVFAGSPAPGAFTVANPSGWPSLSIEVGERSAHGLKGPLAGQQIGPRHIPWWKFWRRKRDTDELDAPIARAYTLRIEADARQDLQTRYLFATRGKFELAGLDIITRFPFGFFEKRRELDQPDHLIVYPQAIEAGEWLSGVHARFGDVARNKRGQGEDFFGLRDYQPGEDQRLIHWKSSARRGEVVVRETESRQQRAVEICLLNCTGLPAHQRHRVAADFEHGLRRTVGLLQELLSGGWRVGLRTLDEHIPAGDASNHMDRLLAALALVELRDGVHPMPLNERASTASGSPEKGSSTNRVARILVGLDPATTAVAAGFDMLLPFEAQPAKLPTTTEAP